MELTGINKLEDFQNKHPESKQHIAAWCKLVKTGEWFTFQQMRQKFFYPLEGSESKALFTIGCGRYTIQTCIIFKLQRVFIRNIIENADYDGQNT
ncbi:MULTISPECIES: type II toxin-antitoxin system HigB family toxin [unclassified Nostoc]|uniref:type II toxin-antitoxin system HigB family toxin n=1 Tax=unclassified Nostoc TaxID=2593658 RepID=UPI002AD39F28|nr:type II toxin-antitoxin system HigB family toxin [Nostoc sp. DedQUE03]MDZ7975934.1 type II toxin-antitoxin system HigB family toxin [Nostoc sp. DedQUE03]MDZ8044769.1 type II toxin-antitoxin system HigB family toxin [Nostoc sp. DedQUE02]